MGTKKEIVTKENFEDQLLKSVNEVLEYTHGKRELRTHAATFFRVPPKFSKTKIKKIRIGLGLSQSVFAKVFGVTAFTIQNWEQGLRAMPAPACGLLDLIEKDPDNIFCLMSDGKTS